MRRYEDHDVDVYGTFGVRVGVLVLGLEHFADGHRDALRPGAVVAWEPPAGGDERLARILDELL